MRFCIALVVLALIPVTAHAEFIVKYHIDGHIYVPPGPTGGDVACVAEMDGDPSSMEMLAIGTESYYWLNVGITHIATGSTDWLDLADVGERPLQAYDQDGYVHIINPLYVDVDSDGLIDVLVPVKHGNELKTAVIGWDGTAAAGEAPPRSVARLSHAQPNPSGSAVSFEYFIPERSHVEFRVLDVTGRLVRTLIDADIEAGPHSIRWDGFTDTGNAAEVGSYFYVLKVDDVRVAERSSVLMR